MNSQLEKFELQQNCDLAIKIIDTPSKVYKLHNQKPIFRFKIFDYQEQKEKFWDVGLHVFRKICEILPNTNDFDLCVCFDTSKILDFPNQVFQISPLDLKSNCSLTK